MGAGVDEVVRDLELRVRGDGVDRRLAELGLGALLEALGEPPADLVAKLGDVSNSDASAAKSSSSSGRFFSRTSLTVTAKLAVLPGEVLGLVVVGEA